MIRYVSTCLVVLYLAAACPGTTPSADAQQWPQWRGPHGDGVSQEEQAPLVWSEDRGILWKTALPEWGTSTPAIWNEAIFVTSQADNDLLLMRLNAGTGQIEWTKQVGVATTPREAEKRTTQKFHRLHNNASPSPVTDGEVVIVHFGNGLLAAYDFAGEELWSQDLQSQFGEYTVWWGHANSPVIVGDLVISVNMQDSLADVAERQAESYLIAHDKRTGRQIWKTPRMTGAEAEQNDSYTTPLVVQHAGVTQLVIMGSNQLDAYDPKTGKQLWYLPGIVGGRTITGPVAGNGMVYVTQGQRGPTLAVKLGGKGKLTDRDIAWKHDELTPDSPSPVLWKNLLFLVTDNGIAQCLNAHTGRQYWKERLGGDFKASPLAAEARIYFVNQSGLTTVIAAEEKFSVLSKNQLSAETTASPAVAGGRIYLRSRTHLYCIGQ